MQFKHSYVPIGENIIGFLANPEKPTDLYLGEGTKAELRASASDEDAIIRIVAIGDNLKSHVKEGMIVKLNGQATVLEQVEEGSMLVFKEYAIAAIVIPNPVTESVIN